MPTRLTDVSHIYLPNPHSLTFIPRPHQTLSIKIALIGCCGTKGNNTRTRARPPLTSAQTPALFQHIAVIASWNGFLTDDVLCDVVWRRLFTQSDYHMQAKQFSQSKAPNEQNMLIVKHESGGWISAAASPCWSTANSAPWSKNFRKKSLVHFFCWGETNVLIANITLMEAQMTINRGRSHPMSLWVGSWVGKPKHDASKH